jgi:hypothetical protein
VTTIVLRFENTPAYDGVFDSKELLFALRAEWKSDETLKTAARNGVQMFTGKMMSQFVAGIAFQGRMCDTTNNAHSWSYSVVSGVQTDRLACAQSVAAHELGHAWGASHCTCSGTMNTFMT